MNNDIDGLTARLQPAKRACRLACHGLTDDLGQRADASGRRRGIGGIGLDEDLRTVAANQLPLEIGGDGQDVRHIAARQHRARLGLGR
ncbi:hypothetical protein D3C83_117430 [compost metagenome]